MRWAEVIVDALVNALCSMLKAVLMMIPAYSLPQGLSALSGTLGESLAAGNAYFPVASLGIALGIALGARVFIAAWAVLVWVYDKFPFKAT